MAHAPLRYRDWLARIDHPRSLEVALATLVFAGVVGLMVVLFGMLLFRAFAALVAVPAG